MGGTPGFQGAGSSITGGFKNSCVCWRVRRITRKAVNNMDENSHPIRRYRPSCELLACFAISNPANVVFCRVKSRDPWSFQALPCMSNFGFKRTYLGMAFLPFPFLGITGVGFGDNLRTECGDLAG